jgi:hypothetical protein
MSIGSVASIIANIPGLAAAPVYVEDVFSTYLYEGNGGTQTITNGIDLANEEGMVWIKDRSASSDHRLYDTVGGSQEFLSSNQTNPETTDLDGISAFNSDGFDIGDDANINASGDDYVSWTFRSADNFFFLDEVSHTNGADTTVDLSSLGTVGMVTVKRTDSTSDWYTWHRSLSAGDLVYLNLTDAETADASIDVSGTTLTIDSTLATGDYMIYAWAHDVAAFGDSGNESIVACGSYTGNGSTDGPEIDLGWEPQFVIIRNITDTAFWFLVDNMRGIVSGGLDPFFDVNTSDEELDGNIISLQPHGWKCTNDANNTNQNGETYIYLAIRRGPMRKPEAGSDVFAMDTSGGTSPTPPQYNAGWPVDFAFNRYVDRSFDVFCGARLNQGNFLKLNTSDDETADSNRNYDYQIGFRNSTTTDSVLYAWMFRRYPGVFDVVTYEGDGNAGRTVPHNLGVVPEMMVVKNRSTAAQWPCYHDGISTTPEDDVIFLDANDAGGPDVTNPWDGTAPASTEFTVHDSTIVNASGDNYIALLFATLDGISKVGSYTGTGSTQTIDCGFSNGAAFVWIKRWDSTGDWILFDSTRGIVSGDEPYLETNTSNAQVTGNDYIDPDSSGFIVNGGLADINANGGEYIFLAVSS